MRKPVDANRDADQHAHPHSLISAFVIHFIDSIPSKKEMHNDVKLYNFLD